MGDEAVELDETALIEQEVEPLARGELALLVLGGDALDPPALLRSGLAGVEVGEQISRVRHPG
jgi:hypothetical protein